MAIINKFLTLGPVSIAAIAVVYKIFKFPKQDVVNAKQLLYRGKKPLIIGHRGGQNEAPENTITAIETAFQNGGTAVELDLDFTKDGIPVIFHDDTVDRVTDGSGKISNYMYEELSKLNSAAHFPYQIVNNKKVAISPETVPTLYEAVELCMKHNMTIDLDIKSNAKKASVIMNDLSKKYPHIENHVFLSAFNPLHVYTLRKHSPQFVSGLIWRYDYLAYMISGEPRYHWLLLPFWRGCDIVMEYLVHKWLPHFLGISLVVMKKDHLSQRYIQQWKRQDIEVVAWTVNSPLEKKYILEHYGIPIITDSILNVDCEEQTT